MDEKVNLIAAENGLFSEDRVSYSFAKSVKKLFSYPLFSVFNFLVSHFKVLLGRPVICFRTTNSKSVFIRWNNKPVT